MSVGNVTYPCMRFIKKNSIESGLSKSVQSAYSRTLIRIVKMSEACMHSQKQLILDFRRKIYSLVRLSDDRLYAGIDALIFDGPIVKLRK
jgi:hypothetical protein